MSLLVDQVVCIHVCFAINGISLPSLFVYIDLVDFQLNLTNCTLVSTSKNFSKIPLGIYIFNETIVEFDEIFRIKVETMHPRVNILNSTRVSILDDDGK